MKTVLPLFILIVAICSCDKETDSIKPEDKERAAALQTYLNSNDFKLSKYYSETPIDYIDTDQVVKSETDLWQYVSVWLKDDRYAFVSNNEARITQNASKIGTDTSAILIRPYSVKADEQGVAFDFVGHEYQFLKYRLITFSDTLLKVSATWNGKTVISEYTTAP
jgi:hypothetical protein